MTKRRTAATRRAEHIVFKPEWFAPWTVADIHRAVFKRLRKGWPRKSLYDLEDAVSEGMVKLVDWWPEFPSTKKVLAERDAHKAYNYACRFVYGKALERFEVDRARNIRNPVDAIVDTRDEARDYVGTVWGEGMRLLHDDEFTDEEREGRMLALLLAKYEAGELHPAGEKR